MDEVDGLPSHQVRLPYPFERRPACNCNHPVTLVAELSQEELAVALEEPGLLAVREPAPDRVGRPLNEVQVASGPVEVRNAQSCGQDEIEVVEPPVGLPLEVRGTVIHDS